MLNHFQPSPSDLGGVPPYGLHRRLMRTAEVHFSAAQVKDCNTTPLRLVTNEDDTLALVYHGAIIQTMGGTANYDQNQNFIVKYDDAVATVVSTTLANFLNGAVEDTIMTIKPLATDVALAAGHSLELTSSASPYNAAGNRELKIQVFYSVYEVE